MENQSINQWEYNAKSSLPSEWVDIDSKYKFRVVKHGKFAATRNTQFFIEISPEIERNNKKYKYFYVSGVWLPPMPDYRASETMAFPAKKNFKVESWAEWAFVPYVDVNECIKNIIRDNTSESVVTEDTLNE